MAGRGDGLRGEAAIVWNVAESEAVTCGACLAANRDGLDALFHEIEAFLHVQQAVPV